MSTPPLKTKQSSRWGSLLSGAVANLESRLDTILADETTIASRNAQLQQGGAGGTSAADRPSWPNDGVHPAQSRSSSVASSQRNGRSSRLALPDATEPKPTSRTASEIRGPVSSLATEAATDIEPKSRNSLGSTVDSQATIVHGLDTDSNGAEVEKADVQEQTRATESPARTSLEKDDTAVAGEVTVQETIHPNNEQVQKLLPEEYQAQIAQMQSDHETAELQRQEEVHTYLERIDALQSKLQYLAKESAESAQQAASEAPLDSLEKRLAAKDHQIALLMEEGQQLSKAEVAQSGAARKLRSKIAEDGRLIADMKRKLANTERSSTELSERTRRLEIAQKDASARLVRLPRLERELESLKSLRDEKESTIQVLRTQIESDGRRNDEAVKQVNSAALEEHRKHIESLEEDLSSAKIEKQLSEDRSRTELKAAKEELQNEQERKKAAELGLRNEISVLESRLESLRARTEEASSGNTNDSQAKLLRQIETLQSQYSLARENWQGIETSLQARVTTLENERTEITRQEGEARKKAREAGNNARRLQESFDEVSRRCQVLEHDLTLKQANADKLEVRVSDFEKLMKATNDKFEQERQSWEANLGGRIEEERKKWQQEVGGFAGQDALMAHAESPNTTLRRTNTLELPGFPGKRPVSRNASTELSIPTLDKSHSRRSSMKPGRPFDIASPNGFESGRSTPFFNGYMPDTPSINEMDPDEMVETGSSPQRTVNDMISGSTSAAGPSVQLVERMSAKVRRLETEKAASKDELARISGQRDEARKEVVTMMREIEEKRAVDAKVSKLESEMGKKEELYERALEMLGEKSEKVEELEADVADLKKIYRELVESTIK